jgi:hypothetical protein
MDIEEVKRILNERFTDFDGDYSVTTIFKLFEIDENTVRIIIKNEAPRRINNVFFFKGNREIDLVKLNFVKDLIERIEFIADWFQCDVFFLNNSLNKDFVLKERN